MDAAPQAALVAPADDDCLLLVGMAFLAFGMFASSLTSNQIVAWMVGAIPLLLLVLLGCGDAVTRAVLLEAGADDVVTEDDGSIEVTTAPEHFSDVVAAMEAAGLHPENAEVTMRASTEVELDAETGSKVLRFLDILEDLDDTQAVYSNADIPESAYEDE